MTLEDMGIPAHLAGSHDDRVFDVRASRIEVAGRRLTSELWIGGGYTAVGVPVGPADVAGAWVIDCAGELPGEFASVARLYIPRVFEDIEQTPTGYPEILALAGRLARVIDGAAGGLAEPAGASSSGEPPERVYVMCKQGLNRSGLMLGRVLRALGLSGDEVVRTLRTQRPGALGNLAFEQLLHR